MHSCFLARQVGLGPVDHRNGVIRLRIVGIDFRSLFVILLGQVELFLLQVEVGDALHAVDILGVGLQHQLVLFDGLLRHADIFRGVYTSDVLLGVSRRQVEPRVDERGIERYRLLEVINRLLELVVLESLHAFIELVARLQLVATGAEQQHQTGGQYH